MCIRDRPYHQLIFTAHKLVALGLVVFIAFFVVNFLKANPVAAGIVPVLVTGVLFAIGLFVSGAMVSVDKGFVIMLWIHRITTAGFVICLSAVFYIVVKR